MQRFQWSSALFLTGLLTSCSFTSAHTFALQEPAQPIEAPKPAQGPSPDSAFADARRLLQQGKYDEALAQLQALAVKWSDLKGLSHELGVACYKKGDHLRGDEYFKKELEERSEERRVGE